MELRGYEVVVETVVAGELRIELLGPRNPYGLLDRPEMEARFERDEYLPYWATLWPAALILADEVARWPRGPVPEGEAGERGPAAEAGGRVIAHPELSMSAGVRPENVDVLELGCGLGLVGLVAAARGYRVGVADWDDDALEFVRASARRNDLPEPATLRLDWRQEYPELRPGRIVAADVLYEARNLQPVAAFVRAHLRRDGFALIADANRSTADAFPEAARGCGLEVAVRAATRADARGRVFELRHGGTPTGGGAQGTPLRAE